MDVTILINISGDIILLDGTPQSNGIEHPLTTREFGDVTAHLYLYGLCGLEIDMVLIMLAEFVFDRWDYVMPESYHANMIRPASNIETLPFVEAVVIDPRHHAYGKQVNYLRHGKRGITCQYKDRHPSGIDIDVFKPEQLMATDGSQETA